MSEIERPCRAKIGLLILRDCGAPSKTLCVCGRPICRQHRTRGPDGDLCPECALRQQVGKHALPVRRARQRRHYYSNSRYRPYYYGYSDRDEYFDDYDYRTFDRERDVDHEPLEDILPGLEDSDEGREWLGLDDFGDS